MENFDYILAYVVVTWGELNSTILSHTNTSKNKPQRHSGIQRHSQQLLEQNQWFMFVMLYVFPSKKLQVKEIAFFRELILNKKMKQICCRFVGHIFQGAQLHFIK